MRTVLLLTSMAIIACSSHVTARPPTVPIASPTFRGTLRYEDGKIATDGLVVVTDLVDGKPAGVFTVNANGEFYGSIPAGEYAFAIASHAGFAWIERQSIPDMSIAVVLSTACQAITGRAPSAHSSGKAQAALLRRSKFTGDTFMAPVHEDDSFQLCVPDGSYKAFLTGDVLSLFEDVEVAGSTSVELRAYSAGSIRHKPDASEKIVGDLNSLVDDIARSNPRIIGIGEGTHGTAEFYTARGALTFELIRRADMRMLFLEIDAIAATALDDYVNGGDIDLEKAVKELGFWITNVEEFLAFLNRLREYNVAAKDKVHLWGIDVQNTILPADILLQDAPKLGIGPEDQATLRSAIEKRGRPFKEMTAEQRERIDALLARLAIPVSSERSNVLVAVAARSLSIQLHYWDGDVAGHYNAMRDAGMARMVVFLAGQTSSPRIGLWAHDSHISKAPRDMKVGYLVATELAKMSASYYAVALYVLEGSVRAWDAQGKVGIISHPIPPAAEYTVERVLMTAAGMPEIAWMPLRQAPKELARWLELPRYVREVAAVFVESEVITLRSMRESFDAIGVIRSGHDTTPTASARAAMKK